jgi:hypothetical protein
MEQVRTNFEGLDQGCFIVYIGGDDFDALRSESFGFVAGWVAGYGSHFVCTVFESVSYNGAALGSGRSDDCENW